MLAQWPCHRTGCILTTAVHVRSQGSPRGICGGHGDTGTGFPLRCESFEFPLSVSFYRGSIFTHVSLGGGGGLHFHRDIVSTIGMIKEPTLREVQVERLELNIH
jgi:hypothetical protein